MSDVPSSYASVLIVSLILSGFPENRLKLEEFLALLWLKPLPSVEPAPNHHQCGQGVKHIHHRSTQIDKPIIHCVSNWLMGRAKRVEVNYITSGWQLDVQWSNLI